MNKNEKNCTCIRIAWIHSFSERCWSIKWYCLENNWWQNQTTQSYCKIYWAKKWLTLCKHSNACKKFEGPFHNKSLKGLRIFQGLQNAGGNSYENGTILDPQSGKTYKLKGQIVEGGKKLELRGFIGVSVLGRNQVWIRAN